MKHALAMRLSMAVLLLTALGLGISILYSDYIYNPDGGFSSLQIERASSDPAFTAKTREFLLLVDRWAREHQTTILFKDGASAGCGFAGYSDWANTVLAPTHADTEVSGVYIQNSRTMIEPYIHHDMLVIGRTGFPVSGTYEGDSLPPLLSSVEFLYPLTAATRAEGMYFVDAKELDTISDLFERNGYVVLSQREGHAITLALLLRKLFSGAPLATALGAALAGVMFCFLYIILFLYRDITRTLCIHHLFGLSRRRILLCAALLSASVLILSMLLVDIMLSSGLTYLQASDNAWIMQAFLTLSIGLILAAHMLGLPRLMRHLEQKGGRIV